MTGTPAARPRRAPYHVAELAAELGIDQSTVRRMIYKGMLRAERHGPKGGAIRIPADAVTEYRAAAVIKVPA